MRAVIRKQEDFITSKWSGGDTTQLYLYPEQGEYKTGNFQVRISSATVEAERSDFTSLPGVERYLMIFQGHLDMTHGSDEKVSLEPYETDRFDGGVPTVSFGRVVDFNLMLKNGARGEMEGKILKPGEKKKLSWDKKWNLLAVYVRSGEIQIQEKRVEKNQLFLCFDWNQEMEIDSVGAEPAGLGICRVQIKKEEI